MGVIPGLGIIALALLLALVTTHWFEKPVRSSPRLNQSQRLTVVVSLLIMTPPAAALLWWESEAGNLVLEVTDTVESSEAEFYPTPFEARIRWLTVHTELEEDCVVGPGDDQLIVCNQVVNSDSSMRIAAFGASHIYQWNDALVDIATDNGANLDTFYKLGCVPSLDEEPNECTIWFESALDEILADPPHVVVMSITETRVDSPEFVSDGKMLAVERLLDSGVRVVGIRDNPRFEYNVPDCVEARGVENCARELSDLYSPLESLPLPEGDQFQLVDYSDAWCWGGTCPVVLDGILAYVDDNHLSWAWTRANRGQLEIAMLRAMLNS